MTLIAHLNDAKGTIDDRTAKVSGVVLLSGSEDVFTIAWKQPDPNNPRYYRQAHASEDGSFVVFPLRRIRAALKARGLTAPVAVDVWAIADTLPSAIAKAEAMMAAAEAPL
jgi:hypothetical protein